MREPVPETTEGHRPEGHCPDYSVVDVPKLRADGATICCLGFIFIRSGLGAEMNNQNKIRKNLAQIEILLGYERLDEQARAELRIARIRLLLMLV